MKRLKIFAFLISTLLYAYASGQQISIPGEQQIQHPVKWSFSVEKVSETERELIFKASIQKGWHMYSMSSEGGMPLTINFEKDKRFKLLGKTIEPKPHEEYDKLLEAKVGTFENEAVFRQKIQLLTSESFTIKGTLQGQACINECILLNETFEFNIEGKQGVEKPAVTKKDSDTAKVVAAVDTTQKHLDPGGTEDVDLNDGCGSLEGDNYSALSAWSIFIQGLIGGFLALLTPCVFSMIPLTVSFFIKQSKARSEGFRNSFVYSLSIILIYVSLGFLITKLFGSDTLNKMASDVWFNLFFFFIFIVFASSFLGAFEITLPNSWANKADKVADRGGMVGIFFMAFTLALVSFSCTGPIIGTLLVQAAVNGNNLGPLLGMTGFALALALPFSLFAAFPAWLNTLPKSGGWLNSVKVSLGFVELALALKFFSNVDLAYHWGILPRELFISLWIVIFGSWGFYLLGKITFNHDTETKNISVSRYLYALAVLSFTVYLVPGLWGAPLKLISGFPPPDFYKEWNMNKEATHCPHDLPCFHDYDEGMAYAKNQGKPVMIDFTGWSCVNCRKMEANVWSDPEILKRLRDDYVLISLYVDDKTPLPEKEQKISVTTGSKIKTLGNKWSDLQISAYRQNSQPYYVLIDNRGKKIASPRGGYNPDITVFKQFLDEGLCRYKKRKE